MPKLKMSKVDTDILGQWMYRNWGMRAFDPIYEAFKNRETYPEFMFHDVVMDVLKVRSDGDFKGRFCTLDYMEACGGKGVSYQDVHYGAKLPWVTYAVDYLDEHQDEITSICDEILGDSYAIVDGEIKRRIQFNSILMLMANAIWMGANDVALALANYLYLHSGIELCDIANGLTPDQHHAITYFTHYSICGCFLDFNAGLATNDAVPLFAIDNRRTAKTAQDLALRFLQSPASKMLLFIGGDARLESAMKLAMTGLDEACSYLVNNDALWPTGDSKGNIYSVDVVLYAHTGFVNDIVQRLSGQKYADKAWLPQFVHRLTQMLFMFQNPRAQKNYHAFIRHFTTICKNAITKAMWTDQYKMIACLHNESRNPEYGDELLPDPYIALIQEIEYWLDKSQKAFEVPVGPSTIDPAMWRIANILQFMEPHISVLIWDRIESTMLRELEDGKIQFSQVDQIKRVLWCIGEEKMQWFINDLIKVNSFLNSAIDSCCNSKIADVIFSTYGTKVKADFDSWSERLICRVEDWHNRWGYSKSTLLFDFLPPTMEPCLGVMLKHGLALHSLPKGWLNKEFLKHFAQKWMRKRSPHYEDAIARIFVMEMNNNTSENVV